MELQAASPGGINSPKSSHQTTNNDQESEGALKPRDVYERNEKVCGWIPQRMKGTFGCGVDYLINPTVMMAAILIIWYKYKSVHNACTQYTIYVYTVGHL